MGAIVSSKAKEEGKSLVEVSVNNGEALQLKGHVDNIHLFSLDGAVFKTKIASRGKNDATKYFLIPKELRKELDVKDKVVCQKMDIDNKTVFIYSLEKNEHQKKRKSK